MKRSLRFIAITGLLCLSTLGTACENLTSTHPAYGTSPPTTEGPPIIPPMPTSEPYPIPTRRPTPTPGFPPTKTPPSPTPIPTATPPPTALPLPPSAFDVLWVETRSIYSPESPFGVIWWADPRDVANRQEVIRFDGKEIALAALSPNGRQIALTTAEWRGPRPLWVVNLDGTDLRQVVPTAGQFLWNPNSQAIFYALSEPGSPTKLASISLQGQGWVGIERVDLASGEIQRILTIEPSGPLQLLGWSAGGQWLYHIRRNPETHEFELWKTRQDGRDSQFIISLGLDLPEPSKILLSPHGSKLFIGTYDHLGWISTEGQDWGDIALPRPGGYLILSGLGENQVIVAQPDQSQPLYHLYALNIQSQQTRELATFGIPTGPGWDQLNLSPDQTWLMAYLYGIGYYWIYLPTGATVPIPVCHGCEARFVAWLPAGAGR